MFIVEHIFKYSNTVISVLLFAVLFFIFIRNRNKRVLREESESNEIDFDDRAIDYLDEAIDEIRENVRYRSIEIAQKDGRDLITEEDMIKAFKEIVKGKKK